MDLVSIVVPVYNTKLDLFRRCVDSLLLQTYKAIEIILVDDGSTNGVEGECDIYAQKNTNIKVIHKKNEGLSAARNSGQKTASGQWIMFVDSDDWINRDTCMKMLSLCTKDQTPDLIVGGYVQHIGKKIKKCTFIYRDKQVFKEKECKKLLFDALQKPFFFSSSCGKLFNMRFLNQNGLYHNENIRQGSEDLEFLIRVLNCVQMVVESNARYYHYIMTKDSITNSFNKKNAYLVLKCFVEIEKNISHINNNSLKKIFYVRSWYAICASVISGFMNPNNSLTYVERKIETKKYLNTDFSKRIMSCMDKRQLDISHFLLYKFAERECYFPIYCMAIIRGIQKGR